MIFLIILLISLLLRLGRFDFPASYIFAWGDGTRDYLVANHILRFHEFPLLGPFNLLNDLGIRNSPIYFYIISLMLALFQNILALSFINILLQISVIVLIYYLVKKLFDYPTALIAVTLFSFNLEIIKQADFVWQPFLMFPVALLSLYFLFKSYHLLSLSLLCLAITIHNSVACWLPFFFFFKKAPIKIHLKAFLVICLTFLILYLPVLIFYLKNGFPEYIGSPIFSSPINYFSNLKLNAEEFLSVFYLNNGLIILLGLAFLVSLKVDSSKRRSLIFLFLLLISSIIFAAFLNKIRLHYFTVALAIFPILVARITFIFKPQMRILIVLFLLFIFSNNFAYFKEFKQPLQNQKRVDQIVSVLTTKLNKIKTAENYSDYDFFQVRSFAVSEVTIPYPVLDTFLLVPLEERLGKKLVQISDQSPYNHFQINQKKYLLVSCFKIAKERYDCLGVFKYNFPDYNILKMIYNDESVSIYLAKHVQIKN